MDSNPTTTTTQYQQVTVDVPEDRIAEFHAVLGRFLAGRVGRGRRGRPGRHHHHGREGGCGRRHDSAERTETPEQAAGPAEL